MNSFLMQAFSLGRAAAEILTEQASVSIEEALSELGKFSAQQQNNLYQFVQQVQARAEQGQTVETTSVYRTPEDSCDLQALIDDLRAEIAAVRVEMQQFRDRPTNHSNL